MRSVPGTERPDARASFPAGAAMSTAGFPNRSASRPATMPMTPAGQVTWLKTSAR